MHTYKPGDTAYLLESNRMIVEGRILRRAGDFYLFGLPDGGGIRVRGNRLYPSREALQGTLLERRRRAGAQTIRAITG